MEQGYANLTQALMLCTIWSLTVSLNTLFLALLAWERDGSRMLIDFLREFHCNLDGIQVKKQVALAVK